MQDYVYGIKGRVTELLPFLGTGNDTPFGSTDKEVDTISAKQHC